MSALASIPILAASGGWFDFLHTMKGPQFLAVYFGWFLVTFVAVLVLRWRGYDSLVASALSLAAFELLGVVRIVVGSWYGMQNWGFLIFAMMLGALFFVLRASHFEGVSGSGGSSSDSGWTWWGGDSGGSSSGDSGGGGGGCGGGGGGCGGCGGGGD